MTFRSSATTHVGMVRKVNQDSFAEREDIGVWAVADGMGGHEAGEIASKTLTDFIKGLEPCENMESTLTAVEQSIMAANRQLTQQAASYESQRKPGSTIAALIIDGDRGAVVWAGDSRVYRCRDQVISQLTRDHSHVQELVEQGVILQSEAESHPKANMITRAVGAHHLLNLDSMRIDVRRDDQFLLCSDGLSRLVSNEEIESMMVNKDSKEVVRSLLDTALARGADDNVTLICVKDTKEGALP